MKGPLFGRLIDAVADGAALIVRVVRRFGAPFVRLARLASLRAQARGRLPWTTQFDGLATAVGTGELVLGDHCRLGAGVQFDTTIAGRISVGSRVRINTGSVVVANSVVSIGDDTLIGEYVSIRDANHGIEPGEPMRSQDQKVAKVTIGRDVWIGRGCCILPGVTVFDGAVVGANSVVTRDVAAGSIHAGAPARQIGMRGRSGKEHVG
jgi:acetyltransferase-like isoleucine patch superfamily enzyme